jgi:hypothetical protein
MSTMTASLTNSLGPIKFEKAKLILDARTDSEAPDLALTVIVSEAQIDAVLQRIRGKEKLKKTFR